MYGKLLNAMAIDPDLPDVNSVSNGQPRGGFVNGAAVPELLSPAGSFQCAEAAFEHGADAVYAGIGNFNLRAHAPNFSVDEFAELIDFANDRGKKVYGVLNIMPDDEMLANIEDTLRRLFSGKRANSLAHALIISDPGVLSLINDIFRNNNRLSIPIHLSTQNGCFNSKSMQFWRNQGVTRIILPRELNLCQISRMSSFGMSSETMGERGTMETEVFIHGAMCVSVSGRCLMGTYYNKRHPNLGDCPQPCRFKYKITPDYKDGVKLPDSPAQDSDNTENTGFFAEEDENGVYLLNSKDLCTIEILPDIIKSGVASLKIEGRNKTAHYVASVVKVYRDAINTYVANPHDYHVKTWWINELESIEHRPYTTGFYNNDPIKQELFTSKAQAAYRLAGTVKAVIDGRPVIDVKNSFSAPRLLSSDTETPSQDIQTSLPDMFNVLPVKHGRIPFNFHFETMREFDDDQRPRNRARPNRLIILDGCSDKLQVGDVLRVRVLDK